MKATTACFSNIAFSGLAAPCATIGWIPPSGCSPAPIPPAWADTPPADAHGCLPRPFQSGTLPCLHIPCRTSGASGRWHHHQTPCGDISPQRPNGRAS